jgi:spore coat protein U-like protein
MRSIAHKLALFAVPFSMVAAGATAYADTDSADMAVSADVVSSCTISAGDLSFGSYDTLGGAAVHGTATLSVACSVDGISHKVTLGEGAHAEGTSGPAIPLRQMSDGVDSLKYKLYSGGVDTTVWGDTALTGKGYTATSSAAADLTVYGTIDANQDVPVGSYTDTVVATITF